MTPRHALAGFALTVSELVERFEDLIAVLQRIADSLEKLLERTAPDAKGSR